MAQGRTEALKLIEAFEAEGNSFRFFSDFADSRGADDTIIEAAIEILMGRR